MHIVKLAGIQGKEVVRDLSCMSKMIEELLTVVCRNNFLQFHRSIWRQARQITGQHSRLVSFPQLHDEVQSGDEPEAGIEIIVSQSNVFGGNSDLSK